MAVPSCTVERWARAVLTHAAGTPVHRLHVILSAVLRVAPAAGLSDLVTYFLLVEAATACAEGGTAAPNASAHIVPVVHAALRAALPPWDPQDPASRAAWRGAVSALHCNSVVPMPHPREPRALMPSDVPP